ncbi:MAG: Gfo/Idh/MocA family protein, partial [Tepidisphaeraceae bacterium]
MNVVNVGLIGCGAISGAYLENARRFPVLHFAACADLDRSRAVATATQFGVGRACDVDELLKDESIEIVLNLTVPKAHVPVGLASLAAGKHVYSEKPLGVNRDEGLKLLEAARARNLR